MSANETMKETIAYTVKHMIAKLQSQGYNEAEIVRYMASPEGLATVKRLAEQFWNSIN